jgi:hypothetical protein
VPNAVRQVLGGVTGPRAEVTQVVRYSQAELLALQLGDPEMAVVLKGLEGAYPTEGELFSQSLATKYLWTYMRQLRLAEGILHYLCEEEREQQPTLRVMIPTHFRGEVMAYVHDSKAAGHFGLDIKNERAKWSIYSVWMSKDT